MGLDASVAQFVLGPVASGGVLIPSRLTDWLDTTTKFITASLPTDGEFTRRYGEFVEQLVGRLGTS
jgi:hypothetical protein